MPSKRKSKHTQGDSGWGQELFQKGSLLNREEFLHLTKPRSGKYQCKHTRLHFAEGEFQVVCFDCYQRWFAVHTFVDMLSGARETRYAEDMKTEHSNPGIRIYYQENLKTAKPRQCGGTCGKCTGCRREKAKKKKMEEVE